MRQARQGVAGFGKLVRLQVGGHDAASGRKIRLGYRAAHAAGGAGDDGDAAVKLAAHA